MSCRRVLAVVLALAGCSTDPASSDGERADGADDLPKLYSSATTLKLALEAPFQKLNTFGTTGALPGEMRIAGKKIPIEVEARGNTSRFECSFLKLEVSFPDEAATTGTAFEGIGSFKIGTHCAPRSIVIGEELEEGSLTGFGRLVSDRAPFREKFLYEIYEQLTPFSHRSRRASITYHDTSSGKAVELFTKPAMILERFKHLRKRHGATELDAEQIRRRDDVDPDHLALAFLFQISILNTDWQVGDLGQFGPVEVSEQDGFEGARTLWNQHALELPAAAGAAPVRIAVPNDFDIAVLGTVWPDRELGPQHAAFDIEDFGAEYSRRLDFFDDLFADDQRRFAIERVTGARDAIARRLAAAKLDPDGAEIIGGAIDAFYGELDQRAVP